MRLVVLAVLDLEAKSLYSCLRLMYLKFKLFVCVCFIFNVLQASVQTSVKFILSPVYIKSGKNVDDDSFGSFANFTGKC